MQHIKDQFEKNNWRDRISPNRFNIDELQRLYIINMVIGIKQYVLRHQAPHLPILRLSEKVMTLTCPFEQFLKALMQVIKQAIPPNKLQNTLQKL